MNGAIAQLKSSGAVTFTVTLSTKSQSGSVTDFIVTVAATAKVPTVLSTIYTSQLTDSVTATADNPVFNVRITLSSFASSAADGDAIYYYVVPADGGAPSSKTQIFNNYLSTCSLRLWMYGQSAYAGSSSASTSVTVSLTAGQKLGFSLVNITGCNAPYTPNGYGSANMNVNTFYSHMFPPSKLAYPTVTKNCALQASTTNASTSGSCATSSPAPGALSCANANGTTYYYYWNDMGGFKDDYDYNDAVYQVTCSGVGSVYSGLVLTN